MILCVATIVTEKTFTEFELMKFSLERFHEVDWYISCDQYVHDKLKENNFNGVCQILIETDDADHNVASEEQKDNWAKIMFTKFDICETALLAFKNPYVLFLDCDMVFANPIEDSVCSLFHEPEIDAMITPHMTNNVQVEAKHGLFNAGMFSVRNPSFLETWRELSNNYKSLNLYFEQQPLEFVSRGFLTLNLPINYNIGWWRFNSAQTANRLLQLKLHDDLLFFGKRPAVNFHMHTVKKLHYQNYGQFLVDHVMNIFQESKNEDYQAILAKYLELNV